jgi:hypothetical protein
MLTSPIVARPSRRTFSFALPLVLLIAACGTAAAPTPSPAQPTPVPTPTAVPGEGQPTDGSTGVGEPGGGGSGSNPGNPGLGGLIPFPLPGDPADNPLLGEATAVAPRGGMLNPQPVNVQLVRAIDGDDGVLAELRWMSGVEDCYGTDSIDVQKDDAARTIHITVLEGQVPGDAMCIEIAVLKATVVDLGDLAAGRWTISAEGDAPAIPLDVE